MLAAIENSVSDAVAAYSVRNPAAAAPFLAQGLALTREAIGLSRGRDEALFLLAIKERQFQDAVSAALGLRFRAAAAPLGAAEPSSPFSPQATMGPVVPGQKFQVDVSLVNPSGIPIRTERIALEGAGDWQVEGDAQAGKPLRSGAVLSAAFTVTAPQEATLSRRYFHRESIHESRYRIRQPEYLHRAGRPPALAAAVDYSFGGQSIRASATVYRREANLPYGYEFRELKVAPALAVNVSPANLIVPLGSARNRVSLAVELLNNRSGEIRGEIVLELPDGWRAQPARQPFSFSQANARRNFTFSVSAPQLRAETYDIRAVARAEGREYREGYRAIRHRDYDIRYLYRDALTRIRGVDVKIAPRLKVGYVMGVGDEVPGGIEQMGAQVALLNSGDLAAGDLDAYGAIVIGTRAYAVRRDLIEYNRRLLDYARRGGNLIVLYQTQEFVPGKWAAFPADLPRRAEEVSEEDSPVKILAPDHPLFRQPNRIAAADFEGWAEQRGSKFFSSWDDAYIPLIETQDRGQEPQKGGWLTASYGEGHYTYFAYAVHRQLPYSVPGALPHLRQSPFAGPLSGKKLRERAARAAKTALSCSPLRSAVPPHQAVTLGRGSDVGLRGHENSQLRYVVGLLDPFPASQKRRAAAGLRGAFFDIPSQARAHRAGYELVDADVELDQLLRQNARQHPHAGLGDRVRGVSLRAAMPHAGSGKENLARAAGLQVGNGFARAIVGADQVQFDSCPPAFDRAFVDARALDAAAGVQENDIDAAVGSGGSGVHGADGAEVGDVRAHGRRFAAFGPDRRDCRLELVLGTGGAGNAGAFPRVGAGDCRADAAARPGNQGDFVLESSGHA